MGGHFIRMWRLSRVRLVLIAMVTTLRCGQELQRRSNAELSDELARNLLSFPRGVASFRFPSTRRRQWSYHGLSYNRVLKTKRLIDQATASDTTGVMEVVGSKIKAAFEEYSEHLTHKYAKATFLLGPFNLDEAKKKLWPDNRKRAISKEGLDYA